MCIKNTIDALEKNKRFISFIESDTHTHTHRFIRPLRVIKVKVALFIQH